MKAIITSFYLEPKYALNVSHKVHQQLEKQVNALLKKYNSKQSFSVDELWVIFNCRKIRKTKIDQLPDLMSNRKRAKSKIFVTLPFAAVRPKTFLYDFVTLVCDALTEILNRSANIPMDSLLEMKQKCLKEIVGNRKYDFKDEVL